MVQEAEHFLVLIIDRIVLLEICSVSKEGRVRWVDEENVSVDINTPYFFFIDENDLIARGILIR